MQDERTSLYRDLGPILNPHSNRPSSAVNLQTPVPIARNSGDQPTVAVIESVTQEIRHIDADIALLRQKLEAAALVQTQQLVADIVQKQVISD